MSESRSWDSIGLWQNRATTIVIAITALSFTGELIHRISSHPDLMGRGVGTVLGGRGATG